MGGFRSWGKVEDLCRARGVQPQSEGPRWAGEQGAGTHGGGFLLLQDCLLFPLSTLHFPKGSQGTKGQRESHTY